MENGPIKNIIKTAHQESQALMQNGVRINDLLWYYLLSDKYHPNELGIHLYAMDLDKTFSSAKNAFKLYKQSLRELAQKIKTDSKLTNVSQISAYSPIVYEHPKLLEALGFKVLERNEEKKEGLAIMSKEDFLQVYA